MTYYNDLTIVRRIDKANVDKIIACLSKLNTENENNKLVKIWSYLAEINKNIPLEKQELTESYKSLILNITNAEKEAVITEICSKLMIFKEFSGSSYYSSLKNLENFLMTNKIEDITITVSEKEVSSEIFVDYVSEAKDEYERFKLKANSDKLDSYFTNLLPDKLSNTAAIQILKKDKAYSFKNLLDRIETAIENTEVSEANLESILVVYKILSPANKKLSKQIDANKVITIYSAFSAKYMNKDFPSCYYDLIAMITSSGTNLNITVDDKVISEVAECIECYSDYGDLLKNCISWNIPVLNSTLKYISTR